MTSESISKKIKKALYLGPTNGQTWRLLDDFRRRGELIGVEWFLEPLDEHISQLGHGKLNDYSLFVVDVSVWPGMGEDHFSYLAEHVPLVPILGVTVGHHPGLARLMLSGRVQDLIHIGRGQDMDKIYLMMTACYNRRGGHQSQPIADAASLSHLSDEVSGPTMRGIAARVPHIVDSAVTCIHITGESGTGKELVARMFRNYDPELPFVSLNCAAIPETLLESVLFGSIKGSYTGSIRNQKGYFEEADGGWIFLDEIACLSKSAQAALLRAVENQEVTRLGDAVAKPLNFRVISATNASLKELVQKGEFRADLYQRLAEIEIVLPPVRERSSEIPGMIDALVKAMAGGPYQITDAAKALLAAHPWAQGNVRQLRNCLKAMTECQVGGFLTPQSIPKSILAEACAETKKKSVERAMGHGEVVDLTQDFDCMHDMMSSMSSLVRVSLPMHQALDFSRLTLELFSEVARLITIRQGRFSTRDIAETLGISRSTVCRKLNEVVSLGIGDWQRFL